MSYNGITEPPKFVTYEGLIVTTIKLQGLPDGKTFEDLEDGDKVVFTEMDGNEGSKVSFLKNIEQDANESTKDSYRVYNATFVSPAEAAKIADFGHGNGKCTPLFYVHGFNNEPNWTLGVVMPTALERLKRCREKNTVYPIPVVWPVYGNKHTIFNYFFDQIRNSKGAGKSLKAFVDGIPSDLFPKKSVMIHSMGNHLVFNGALGAEEAPDVIWENIFMVAADIPRVVFSENPGRGDIQKATHMKAILREGGKIFVLHHEDDTRLKGSRCLNLGERLGRHGPNEIRSDLKDTVVVVDTKPFSDNNETDDDPAMHSYQFEEWAIDVYNHPEKYCTSHNERDE